MTAKKKVWIILAAVVVAVCAGLGVAAATGAGPEPLVRLLHGGRSISAAAQERPASRRKTAGRNKKPGNRETGSKNGGSATAAGSGSTTTAGTGSETGSKDQSASVMRTPIDWQQPSQTTPYPNLATVPDLWIRVSIDGNRTYVMSGDNVIYTMYSSAGVYEKNSAGQPVSDTPTGVFHVEQERGTHFYSQMSNEGANWWVSWKDHGIYLFHSVPVDEHGDYKPDEAAKLGKQPASHGCVRLSVPDAKWLYEQLPVGTKIVIDRR